MNYELKVEPKRLKYNPLNGQFLKGGTPWNKGKKWSEYLSKRMQKRCSKGWANLALRPKKRPDLAGRCRKPVIAVNDAGDWIWLPYIGAAAEYVHGNRENVRRCCKYNNEGRSAVYGKMNTDHRYKGVRFYYESDNKWTTKIKK